MPGVYTYLIKLYLERLGTQDSVHSNFSLALLVAVILSCILTSILRSALFLRTTLFGLL